MNKSFKNIASALLSKSIMVFGPFFIRTIIIYKLGNEYVGLTSLFSSILQVLSLAELGIGSVLTFSMYKPVVEKNEEKLRALLNFYRTVYRFIGFTILGIALVLTPFIPKLISGSYPNDINIYILFWIYITNTVSSYLLFAYRSSILVANQKNNVVYICNTLTQVTMYLVQIIVLFTLKSFYVYIIVLPICTILNNIIVYFISAKRYPSIYPSGKLMKNEKKEIFRQLEALCIHRIAGVLILSLDNIVISAFLGLDVLAKYSNYSYIVTALNGFLDVALVSITSIIGTNIIKYSDEEKYNSFKKASLLSMIVVAFCTVFMFNLYQPFIRVWVGEGNLLSMFEMSCFCVYFYTYKVRAILMTYRDAAGLWKQDVWKSIIGLVINLIGNVLLIKVFGSVGVLITTIVIMVFLFYPWETHVLFKYLFHIKPWQYIFNTIKITIITIIAAAISGVMINYVSINEVLFFLFRIVISVASFMGMLFIAFHKTNEYISLKSFIKSQMKKRV